MRIQMKSSELDFELVALSEIDPAEMQPAKKFGTDDEIQKVDGKEVYRLADVFAKQEGHKVNVSVKVFSKPSQPIEELTRIKLVGSVVITPYVQGNRVALSIVADGVEPVA